MVSKTRTQAFSGGFCAERSVGSLKDLSKLSSTLQHLFITSDWAIGSGDILVGSCVPSYLKAGCFHSWRGCVWRPINEKATWSPVTPFFLTMAIHEEWLQLACHQVLYLASFLGLAGHQQSFLEVEIQSLTWNQNFFHSAPLFTGS